MIDRKTLLPEIAVLITFVSIMHALGLWGFYAAIFWWDVPTHFLGGAFAGLLSLWFIFYSGYWPFHIRPRSRVNYLIIAVAATFFIACLWEVYEYILGPFFTYGNYYFDTAKDITMGTLGAFSGGLYFIKTKIK